MTLIFNTKLNYDSTESVLVSHVLRTLCAHFPSPMHGPPYNLGVLSNIVQSISWHVNYLSSMLHPPFIFLLHSASSLATLDIDVSQKAWKSYEDLRVPLSSDFAVSCKVLLWGVELSPTSKLDFLPVSFHLHLETFPTNLQQNWRRISISCRSIQSESDSHLKNTCVVR